MDDPNKKNQLPEEIPSEKLTEKKFSKDWIIVMVFIFFDIILVILARNYYQSINDLSSQSIVSTIEVEQERKTLNTLEQLAGTGSLEAFEKARIEELAHFLKTNTRPSLGQALYFFPETLPNRSLEKEFALNELKPGIEALKQAYYGQHEEEVQFAYTNLKSRVESYEMGMAADSRNLSEEAKTFLKLYHEFTHFNRSLERKPARFGGGQEGGIQEP